MHNHEDQRASEYLMQVIARTLDEVYELYPTQGPLSAEATLLTAGILMLIHQTGRANAAKAVRSLAAKIESGGFDGFHASRGRTMQ